MPPVYRTRHDFTELLSQYTRTCRMREFLGSSETYHWDSLHPQYDNLENANYIRDEIHSVRDRGLGKGRFPPGYCFHQYTDLSKTVPMADVEELWGGQIYNCRWESGNRPPLYPGQDGLQYFVGAADALPGGFDFRVPSSIVNARSEEAWNYFSDILPACLSFGEFVQGLTQLKDLIPEVGESITGTISGGYLNKKFGWDNLLSDLKTLSTIWDQTLDRMDYFRRTYKVPTRLGFSRRLDWTPPSLGGSGYPGTIYPRSFVINPVTSILVELVEFQANYRATCWIFQHLDYMTDLVGFMRVLAGELGLNNPIKAIWQTIPLSFVVDWFFKISTHLDNLTRLNPPVGWDIYDVTQSVKYNFTFKLTQTSTFDPRGSNYPVVSCLVPVQVYERREGLSFGWELLNPDELSPTQLTLLLAMLHQFSGG